MKKLVIVPIMTILMLSACTNANPANTTEPTNDTTTVSITEPTTPAKDEVSITLDIQLPGLSTAASDFTITFTPKDSDEAPIVVPISPSELTYEKPTINMKRIKYTIDVTSPENPDETTYDMSATDDEVDIEFLESVTDTPTILITGTRKASK